MVRPAKTLVVKPPERTVTREFPGRVEASRRTELAFRVAGPLIELPVDEAQTVERGALLARIDPRDFESAVKRIESSLAEAGAQLIAMQKGARAEDIGRLEAGVAATRARLAAADANLARYADLVNKDFVSKRDFDRVEANQAAAKAELRAAREELRKGRTGARKEDVDAQKARIRGLESQRKAAEDALADTYLRAPFDGQVARKLVDNFDNVQAKQPIIIFQDLSRLDIVVNVPERIFGRNTQPGEVELRAFLDNFPGREFRPTLKENSTEADPQTNTFRVVVTMPAPEGITVLPGMAARVRATVKLGDANGSRLLVPVNAVFADEEEKQYVWVLGDDMRVKRRAVQIGQLTGDSIEISGGLEPGEEIVTAGVNYLEENQAVRRLEGKIGS